MRKHARKTETIHIDGAQARAEPVTNRRLEHNLPGRRFYMRKHARKTETIHIDGAQARAEPVTNRRLEHN
ncbi:hypothetical protein D8Y30_26955, partial [Escherichia coli]